MSALAPPTAERRLMEGSEAIALASIAAGCRFFAGYPMTPFTEVLEHFAKHLPDVGGTCINAESELEAVGMAWGALATGARAATGSTGQGLSLMQESFSEITLAELPLVIFDMARNGGDYFQATRGGGHGDYRHIVLAPSDIHEAVELTQLAFHLADTWRNPVLVYGDYLTAHTRESVTVEPIDFGPVPEKPWALDGSLAGTTQSRIVSPLGFEKVGRANPGIERHLAGDRGEARCHRSSGSARRVRASSTTPRRSSSRSGRRRSSCATSSRSCGPRASASATCDRSRCGRSRRPRSPTLPTARVASRPSSCAAVR